MKIHAPIDGLSNAERTMLIDGLRALRKERGKAWNDASDADAAGRHRPALRQFGMRTGAYGAGLRPRVVPYTTAGAAPH